MSPTLFLCVFVGGGLGASLRWLLGLACAWLFSGFNFGVFIANVVGCFCAGAVAAWFESRVGLPPELRHFLITGVLGGFTTFSSFSLEATALFSAQPLHGGAYLLGTLVLCMAAAFLGFRLLAG